MSTEDDGLNGMSDQTLLDVVSADREAWLKEAIKASVEGLSALQSGDKFNFANASKAFERAHRLCFMAQEAQRWGRVSLALSRSDDRDRDVPVGSRGGVDGETERGE